MFSDTQTDKQTNSCEYTKVAMMNLKYNNLMVCLICPFLQKRPRNVENEEGLQNQQETIVKSAAVETTRKVKKRR